MFAKSLRRQTALVQLAKVGLLILPYASLLSLLLWSFCIIIYVSSSTGSARRAEKQWICQLHPQRLAFDRFWGCLRADSVHPPNAWATTRALQRMWAELAHAVCTCSTGCSAIRPPIIPFLLVFFAVSGEFEQLLVKQSSLEVYFEWLDSLIERRVCEVWKTRWCTYLRASYMACLVQLRSVSNWRRNCSKNAASCKTAHHEVRQVSGLLSIVKD